MYTTLLKFTLTELLVEAGELVMTVVEQLRKEGIQGVRIKITKNAILKVMEKAFEYTLKAFYPEEYNKVCSILLGKNGDI